MSTARRMLMAAAGRDTGGLGSLAQEILADSPAFYFEFANPDPVYHATEPNLGSLGGSGQYISHSGLIDPSVSVSSPTGTGVRFVFNANAANRLEASLGSTDSISAFTMEAILKVPVSGPSSTYWVMTRRSGHGFHFGHGVSSTSGYINWGSSAGGENLWMYNSKDIRDGQWHHLIGTWDPGEASLDSPDFWRLWVDGVELSLSLGSMVGSLSIPFNHERALAVNSPSFTSTTPNIEFDVAATYHTALSEKRIQAHFKASGLIAE